MKLHYRWAMGILVLAMTACAQEEDAVTSENQKPDNSLMRVITGEVWYRERIALPPGAEVRVVLEDQSRMDVPATELTSYTHVADGPPPYAFRLVFSPDAIEDNHRYGLRARIEHDGQLLFTSTEHIDPFAAEPGTPIRIMVSSAGR